LKKKKDENWGWFFFFFFFLSRAVYCDYGQRHGYISILEKTGPRPWEKRGVFLRFSECLGELRESQGTSELSHRKGSAEGYATK
jgi:hypothetical protein